MRGSADARWFRMRVRLKRSRRRLAFGSGIGSGLRAGTMLAAALIAASALSGCSSSASAASSAGSSDAPQALRAEAVASQEFGLLAGGGWAQAWNLWTSAAQKAVSQAAYVQVNKACPTAPGVPYVVQDAVRVDADTMRVSWRHGTSSGTNLIVYEGGSCRFSPSASELAQYGAGADQLIQQRKAQHECR